MEPCEGSGNMKMDIKRHPPHAPKPLVRDLLPPLGVSYKATGRQNRTHYSSAMSTVIQQSRSDLLKLQ